MYAFHPLKLWSYWTKVHQVCIQCSQITVDETSEIRNVMLQSVFECQGDK